jgi:hypothetical protein
MFLKKYSQHILTEVKEILMMETIYFKILIVAYLFVFILAQTIQSQSQMPYSVFGNGGSLSTSIEFTLNSTTGESIIGSSTNNSNLQYAGFWYLYYEDVISSVDDQKNAPFSFKLEQNFPNPFNPTTNIGFRIADRGFVSLKVYDILGNEVATLVNEELPAGSYEVEFGRNLIKQVLTSGVYFYQLKAGTYIETRKMLLLK